MKKELPADVLIKAAALAAYYSRGRNADKVAVTYTIRTVCKKAEGRKARARHDFRAENDHGQAVRQCAGVISMPPARRG